MQGENREEGFYWAFLQGEWTTVERDADGDYAIVGSNELFAEKDFDKIGPKIEPPAPKHVCSFSEFNNTVFFGTFLYCPCGAIMTPATSKLTDIDLSNIRETLRTPGAVFEIL